MGGAPQSGFSRLIVRIKSRTCFGTLGRPGFPRRIFQVQNKRKPLRCQPTTVAACMMKTADFQSCQTAHNHAHKSRSAGVSFGRFTERCRTPIWCRRARTSNWSAARLRNEAASEAMSAVNKCPNGNRRMSDKLQFINLIGIYGKHSMLVDDNGIPVLRRSSSSKHIQPTRGDYANTEGNVARVDQIDAHESSPSD